MSTKWRGVEVPVRQNLVKKYGPIGPAAIAAAVAAMKKRRPAPRVMTRRAIQQGSRAPRL
jgi:hypothetical protein